jgi:predicted nucleotidyltransferase
MTTDRRREKPASSRARGPAKSATRTARGSAGRRIKLPELPLAEFCQRWKIIELALFGSALRKAFRDVRDVDFLATFAPDAEWSLLDHIGMEDELTALLGRPADVVSKEGLEQSRNWIRRQAILESARVVYAA